MPRERTLKSIFLEAIVFAGTFALLGHMSVNFWERFVIQKELTNMKTSLHSLKETVYKIGCAYDNLHRELVGLAAVTENKTATDRMNIYPDIPPRKKKSCLERALHDIEIQAIAKLKNNTTLTSHKKLYYNKTVQNLLPEKKKDKSTHFVLENIETPTKNISTNTKYPLKSTGVNVAFGNYHYSCTDEDCCKFKSCTSVHTCCKEYECCNLPDDWKF